MIGRFLNRISFDLVRHEPYRSCWLDEFTASSYIQEPTTREEYQDVHHADGTHAPSAGRSHPSLLRWRACHRGGAHHAPRRGAIRGGRGSSGRTQIGPVLPAPS